MIAPDDPRHGTHRGYIVGCRETCCTTAHTRYMNLYRMGRRNRLVSPVGTLRRVEALQCLGWTMQEIAKRCGYENEWAYNLRRSTRVTSRTAAKVAEVFNDLSMRFPPERTQAERAAATKARRRARRKGYAPPLAYDDIDDPNETPHGSRETRSADDIDPVVVERILGGDRLPATQAEKREVTRRWVAAGRSLAELERRTGWNSARYSEREAS